MWENIVSLLGMLVVIAGILVMAWLCTRAIGKYGVPGSSNRGKSEELSVLRQISIGRNQRLVLLRVGERCLLLGVTEQCITVLTEMEHTEAEDWLREEKK